MSDATADGRRLRVSNVVDDYTREAASHVDRSIPAVRMIELLERLREGEATVVELTSVTGASPQNVSKHLGVLLRAGIVGRRKQGNFAYYSIADAGVFKLCEDVCGSLAEQLESLREVVAGGSR